MSNIDFNPDPEEFLHNELRNTRAHAITSLEDDPEQAARALQVAEAAGANPALVYGDLEHFEAQHRAVLTANVLDSNPQLQEYIRSNALAAKVSNDDYGQLDTVSSHMEKLIGKGLTTRMLTLPSAVAGEAFSEFKKGFGSEPIGDWITRTPEGKDFAAKYPFSARLMYLEGGAFEIPARTFTGLLSAIHGAVRKTAEQVTGDPEAGKQFARDVTGLAEQQLMGLGPRGFHVADPAVVKTLEPYAKAGKEPPVGVHEMVDDLKIEQAKVDRDNLAEALKEAAASNTRERSPELFEKFLEQHTDGTIGVSADAVRALYGDKVPGPDDGLLGWVPRLQEQLQTAEATGGDVQIPLASWLARVEPDVAKALQDHVRFREGGVTVEEAKQGIEVYHGSPHEFEAFDISKAGTGEGAQSYGFGHYFAENPEVAESYKVTGATAPPLSPIIGESANIKMPEGQLYKARILRHPDEFLDWDKPLTEQTPIIQEAIKKVFGDIPADYKLSDAKGTQTLPMDVSTLIGFKEPDLGGPEGVSKKLHEAGIAGIKYLDQFSREGKRAKLEAEKADFVRMAESETDPLLKASRLDMAKDVQELIDKEPPLTSNFVVFRDSDIQVLERNGQIIKDLREANRLQPLGVPEEPTMAARPEQLQLPETTRMEDRAAFEKAGAIGMTVDQYRRYQALIAKRLAEDAKYIEDKALAQQRREQTAEWKANRAELRPKVREDILAQPEYELDELAREGKVKFSADSLTPEQIAGLPPEWVAKRGIHPDDLAGLFGESSGRDVVDRLVGLNEQRTASGMKPEAFIERVVDAETDRRMEEKFGKLDENVIREARDQVLSATQEDMLHEEMLALAAKNDLQFSLTKDQVAAAVKESFDATPISAISTDRFLADAGRAGRAAELALLKGEAAEAFRQKQRQFLAFSFAREAKKLERARESFEKTAKRFSAREVANVDQEYTNWVHDILLRTGNPIKRSVQDLQESLSRGGGTGTTTLADFVNYKELHDLREVPVAEFLQDPRFQKPVDQLSAKEFRDLNDSVRALVHNGRDEAKIIKAGEAADLAEIKGQMLEQIKRFKEKEYDASGKRLQFAAGPRHLLRTALVSHLQAETVLNRLDRFDPRGVFSQYVFRELASAANHEASLLREYSKKLGAIADKADLKEIIPESPFVSPFKRDMPVEVVPPLQMTRKNLRTVMLNMGNESNFHKLATGYLMERDPAMTPGENSTAVFKGAIKAWVDKYATKEDWDWAQKVWDMLEELHQKSNTMYRGLSGIEPEALRISPIQTPHGEYRGGYYPLIRHPTFSADIRLPKNGLEGEGYIRATTPAGYTKSRTGAIYPLSLDLDSFPNQLRQIIHDISFRPAVIQAGKIFYDKGIMAAMKKHLGTEYADMFVPWLRDVANVQNFMSGAEKDFAYWSEFMRQNAITTLVGLNVGTFMKHTPTALVSSMAEVGPANFLKAMRSLASINEATGESNWSFAMKTSEELQRRSRNWVETMGGGLKVLEGRTAGKAIAQGEYGAAFMSLRDTVTELSSKPVAMGDLLSAVPTWVAKYEAEMREHGIHGDAVYAADKAVRQAHGSSAVTSRSQVARSRSALASWMTGFFTFFNDLFNRQVETLWRAGEIKGLVKEGQYKDAMTEARNVAGRLFAYVIAPAMIEELVTPLASDKGESWFKTAAKALTFTLSSSWVGVRDLVNAALNARDPSVGLLTTMYKSGTDVIRDLRSVKIKPDNVLKHGTQLSGMLTGLTPAPIGRAAEFAYRVNTNQERPKGPWGWLVGLRYGTLKHHSTTFEEYMKGH